MKRVYICGKVSGEDPDKCYAKFRQREYELLELGYFPVNPLKHVSDTSDWIEAMHFCIMLLLQCHSISPLPDTWKSRGAMIEFDMARQLGKDVVIPGEFENEPLLDYAYDNELTY